MSDPKATAPEVQKVPLGDIDESNGERHVTPLESAPSITPLESALAKWEKYFTPEEQVALRAYEAEQGTVE